MMSNNYSLQKNQKVESLNGIRFIFATLVFICHWYSSIGIGYSSFNFEKFGSYSVIFFFSLSGFFLGLKYKDNFAKTNKKEYIIFVKKHFFKGYLLYIVTSIPFIVEAVIEGQNFAKLAIKLLLNLLCIQSFVPYNSSISFNSVGWFTSCLFILYALLPFILRLFDICWNKNKYLLLIIGGICLLPNICMLRILPTFYITPYYRIFQFSIGIVGSYYVVHIANKIKFHILKFIQVIAILLMAILYVMQVHTYFDELMMSLLSVILIISLFIIQKSIVSNILASKILKFFGGISGELYLIHYPIIILLGYRFKSLYVVSLITAVKYGLVLYILTLVLSIVYKITINFINNRKIKEK